MRSSTACATPAGSFSRFSSRDHLPRDRKQKRMRAARKRRKKEAYTGSNDAKGRNAAAFRV